jgi:hypothetical protein
MFKSATCAVIGGALLAGATLSPAAANTYGQRPVIHTIQVTISCFRGPFTEVIWDRPNPVFIDSLVAAGYTFPEAHAIGERVCRDPETVDRPDTAIEVLHRIIAENPPHN